MRSTPATRVRVVCEEAGCCGLGSLCARSQSRVENSTHSGQWSEMRHESYTFVNPREVSADLVKSKQPPLAYRNESTGSPFLPADHAIWS